jgi:hypothetical protein
MKPEDRVRLKPYVPLIVGTIVMFAAAVGIGIVIGRWIWG